MGPPGSRRKKRHQVAVVKPRPIPIKESNLIYDPPNLESIPVTYQAISDYFAKLGEVKPFSLREETFRRIERITGRPLICYIAKTHNLPQGIPAYINDSDITGIGDLIQSTIGEAIDFIIISNGGSAETAERIVRLLRESFKIIRFIIPANAYSAATLLSFSGDEIIMDSMATLGPIDPQINGIPAQAILKAFETVEGRLKQEGPKALTAYMPLISKYDLHILEMCKSAQELSKELAQSWLSLFMLKTAEDDHRIAQIVEFFLDYDIHKSHGRSVDRNKARDLGLKIINAEEIEGLAPLVRSLYNQYEIMFNSTSFFKLFENARGINWGLEAKTIAMQLPSLVPPGMPQPAPQPGPPKRS